MANKAGMKFTFIAGLIPKEDEIKKLMFRRTRGNAMTMISNFERRILDTSTKNVDKCLFVVILQDTDTLRTTVNKVCEAFTNEM
jgi:hypothetical protein